MGRRPNAVVGEFFLRGQKLDDSSNRYQHTCKKCGEHVRRGDPTGRYSLTILQVRKRSNRQYDDPSVEALSQHDAGRSQYLVHSHAAEWLERHGKG